MVAYKAAEPAKADALAKELPGRVVITDVEPQVEGGRFPAKAIAGDRFEVEATIFLDGHDEVAAALRFRRAGDPDWSETAMKALGNDRFAGAFPLHELCTYEFQIAAW